MTTMQRRDFLEKAGLACLGSLTGVTLAHGATAPGGETGTPARARHSSFYPLAPGEVRPQGWLRLHLQKQAQQLAGHLPEVSWPFTGDYWSGEEHPPNTNGWWPWEQRAYWIDGALRCALVLQDENLLQKALPAIEYTLNHTSPDGYLGPTFARDAQEPDRFVDNFRWPHTVFFRALAAYADSTHDPRIADAMRRHYLADRSRAPYGGPSRDVTNVEGMLWAYERTGDRRLLDMAQRAWSGFLRSAPPGDRESGDLHPDRVFANAPIHAHGVTYIEKAKLPAILYMHTGDPESLRFALAAQERIFSHHMLIDGIPSTTEDYRLTTALDAHETCDITDHIWTWGYLLMATGDGVWADRIERAAFNAGLGAVRKDWKAVQYFSCPNQVIATSDSSHVWPANPEVTKGFMAYRPNPGHDVACCGGNVHRLLPNYAIRMWMADARGGLAATLYGASTVQAEVGPERQAIEVEEETDYPFGEEIRFTLRLSKPVKFPLSLRIPSWCKKPQLAFNGRPQEMPLVRRGFIRLERTFHPGDRLTLSLPMHTELSYWPDNGLAFERGPLVYALAIDTSWAAEVEPRWSSPAFPDWNAKPGSEWNYGVAVEESVVLAQTRFERRPMSDDPWIDSPVSLTVPVKKVPGWGLSHSAQHPEREQTPPLPQIDEERERLIEGQGLEWIALVPYGATHLRLTIFPET
jgi:DUF1680 family protein